MTSGFFHNQIRLTVLVIQKGGEEMGMTNEQFDSYKTSQLRLLERAQEEVEAEGKSKTLKQIISDLKSELKKP
jgi:hypothetical protein